MKIIPRGVTWRSDNESIDPPGSRHRFKKKKRKAGRENKQNSGREKCILAQLEIPKKGAGKEVSP